jgi:hypothetical protein
MRRSKHCPANEVQADPAVLQVDVDDLLADLDDLLGVSTCRSARSEMLKQPRRHHADPGLLNPPGTP